MSDITLDWSFGGQLRRYRIRKRITLREVCRKLKTDPGNFSKLERSILPPPNAEDLKKFIKLLDLSEFEKDMFLCAAFNFNIGKLHQEFWGNK